MRIRLYHESLYVARRSGDRIAEKMVKPTAVQLTKLPL
jgi:hypothetical protein